MMLAALSTITIAAVHAEDVKGFQVSGYADLYYQYDFKKPATGNSIGYRQFDIANNSFSLAVAGINISKNPTEAFPFGFTLNLVAGKNADIMASAEPGGRETYKLFQQAYVTYVCPKTGIQLDFGKFTSWCGYEGAVAADQDNYSRGLLYTYSEPVYHFGLRATKTLTPQLGVTAAVVNGWNEIEDSNAGKTFGLSVAYTGLPKTSITLNYMGGTEGSSWSNDNGVYGGIGIQNQISLNEANLIVSYQATPALKLAVSGDYADAKAVDTGDPSGKWRGVAAYAKYTLSDKFAAGVRYETFSDPNGLRTGFDSRLTSLTGTLDFVEAKDATLRFELRHDTANAPVFSSKDGSETKRTTFTVAQVIKF